MGMGEECIAYLESFPVVVFQKEAYIAYQGDPVKYIYFLTKGTCIRNTYTPNGNAIVYDVRKGDNTVSCLLGALYLFCPEVIYTNNFIAKSDCVCHRLTIDEFKIFLEKFPETLYDFLYLSMSTYQNVSENFQSKQRGSTPSRVCSYILKNAAYNKEKRYSCFIPSISKLARLLGIHRVTVNKIILVLCDEGVLEHDGDYFVILDKEQLEAYALNELKLDYKK